MSLQSRFVLIIFVASMLSATPLINVYAITPPCLYPTAWFASEVLLNKPGVQYDLSKIREAGNITTRGLSVVYRSHYNESLAVILTPMELFEEKGLDVRIQIPTRKVYSGLQYIEYSYIDNSTKVQDLFFMGGRPYRWILEQSFSPKVLGGPPIQISNLTKGNLLISIIPLVNETIPGTSITITVKNTLTLNSQNATELSQIFDAIGYPISFEEFRSRAQVKNVTGTTHDLESAIGLDPKRLKWSEAMRTELQWLMRNRVIRGLSDQDIERLSTLAPNSWGDHNLKTRYFNGKWTLGITEEMIKAGVTKTYEGDPDCEGFPLSAMPASRLDDFNASINPLEILIEQSYEGAAIRAGMVGAVILTGIVLLVRRSRKSSREKKAKRRS